MDFMKYLYALTLGGQRVIPHIDEARRDFRDALLRSVDGMMYP